MQISLLMEGGPHGKYISMILDSNNNWICDSNNFFLDGFNDSQLESLCHMKRSIKAPVFFWTTELYGFGKCSQMKRFIK